MSIRNESYKIPLFVNFSMQIKTNLNVYLFDVHKESFKSNIYIHVVFKKNIDYPIRDGIFATVLFSAVSTQSGVPSKKKHYKETLSYNNLCL